MVAAEASMTAMVKGSVKVSVRLVQLCTCLLAHHFLLANFYSSVTLGSSGRYCDPF